MDGRLKLGTDQNYDLHMHTWYCDGNDSPEYMVMAALKEGLDIAGFSGHSFTPHDTSYCMSKEGTEEYLQELKYLRDKYAGQIRILAGIEMDLYADIDASVFDYVIGSLHYMFKDGDWTDVDDTPYKLKDFADRHFGGDMLCLAELYYEIVSDIVPVTGCDIIGHFDLITKFNERFVIASDGRVIDTRSETPPHDAVRLIDTDDPRYIDAWKKAVDKIFDDTADAYKAGWRNRLFDAGDKPVFEINTGAISRGYRTLPYPAQDQIEYIKSKGGLLVLNSDSHSVKTLAFRFDDFKDLI